MNIAYYGSITFSGRHFIRAELDEIRASNWIRLGMTTGRGRMDRRNERQGASSKEIYVYPLFRNFQKRLLGV